MVVRIFFFFIVFFCSTNSPPHQPRSQRTILHHTQKELGNWVGSSVIHLGDNNVPNALLFIGPCGQERS